MKIPTQSSEQIMLGQRMRVVSRHGVGIGLMTAGLSWAMLGSDAIRALIQAGDAQLWRQMAGELGAHVLLSSLVWAGLVCLFRTLRAKPSSARVLKASRGTVITETLIVLMPFMLLTTGLAQVTINNMAGILTNYAAYSAGRTMWVWEPHNSSAALQRAKVAAAAAVTPVAPGSNFLLPSTAADAKQFRHIMYASFTPLAFAAGSTLGVAGDAEMMLSAEGLKKNFNLALDDDSFRVRAARKFTFAYGAIAVTRDNSAGIGAKVVYHHYQAFPALGWVFGTIGVKSGRAGYYMPITRSYSLPTQVN
jgi:hypothetical protein